MGNKKVLLRIADGLNIMLDMEPAAVRKLFKKRVPVGPALAEHAFAIVDHKYTISILGLLNGIRTSGKWVLCAHYDDPGRPEDIKYFDVHLSSDLD